MDRADRKDPFAPQARYFGLSYEQFTTLGRYNAERARGLLHDPRWIENMRELQERFDQGQKRLFAGSAAGSDLDGDGAHPS